MKKITTVVTKKADKKNSIQFEGKGENAKLPGIYIPRDVLKELDNEDGSKEITVILQVD